MFPTALRRISIEPVFLPALQHQRLVLGRGRDRRREALVVPLRTALEIPVAGGVDQHAIPDAGAELVDVALLKRRRRIERMAEHAGEDDDAAMAGIDAIG